MQHRRTGYRNRAASHPPAPVRRNPSGDDGQVSGTGSGTRLLKGAGRLDTGAYSVNIGRTAAQRVVGASGIGYIRSSSTRR